MKSDIEYELDIKRISNYSFVSRAITSTYGISCNRNYISKDDGKMLVI